MINNCLFTNCWAKGSDGGGGLYATTAVLNMTNSVVSDCYVRFLLRAST